MKNIVFTAIVATATFPLVWGQNLYVSTESQISFFSSAPLEDIEAVTTRAGSALNGADGSIVFKAPIKTFEFPNKLMQEHFNENYMESDKYPDAQFVGKIVEIDRIDLKKPADYTVTVKGELTIHGVKKPLETKATLSIKNDGTIHANAKFPVAVADHNIKIPTIVVKNIAEVVEVRVSAVYAKK
ncbi:MAG: YceI family protein [Bacteroidia bacterium]|nr:YceI family protein [Bacteroidia bacterium]MDW8332615.1 YceI family protein [Bacteroidia bacterium]